MRDILVMFLNKINNMKKQSSLYRISTCAKQFAPTNKRIQFVSVTAFFLMCSVVVPLWQSKVQADEFDDQINVLKQKNATNQSAVNDLIVQASDYKATIANLQSQIDSLQASIAANTALQADLQRQIIELQAELARQKTILAADIKAMYVDGMPTSIEMMAGSKDISEFVDKQEYRSRVQTKIQDTLEKIAAIEKQVEAQKFKVEQLIKDQQIQQQQIDADRAKQQELLAMNESAQADYNQKIAANNAEVSRLRAAQTAAINAALARNASFSVPNSGDPRGGGYPYVNGPLDYMLDPWGLYARECVSYAAWKVASTGRFVPHFRGMGNANQWPGTVSQYGIQSGSEPRAGSVAMWDIGYYGHVMYVESVNGDGSITVSDYNLKWDGAYRMYKRPAAGLTYIYF